MWARPSHGCGAPPHRASPANLARSFSAGSPDSPDSPTPLAEAPTIPRAAWTRQLHFRVPRPPPPPRPTRAVSGWRGGERGRTPAGPVPGGSVRSRRTPGVLVDLGQSLRRRSVFRDKCLRRAPGDSGVALRVRV